MQPLSPRYDTKRQWWGDSTSNLELQVIAAPLGGNASLQPPPLSWVFRLVDYGCGMTRLATSTRRPLDASDNLKQTLRRRRSTIHMDVRNDVAHQR